MKSLTTNEFPDMVPHIIGISGKTASGKSTLSHKLSQDLKCTLISWDDFDPISNDPENFIEWRKRGEHYEEFQRKSLKTTLESLKKSNMSIHPATGDMLIPTKYIVFDAPLGRLHRETGTYIDTCIHIELSLDILLCRRILRDFQSPEITKEEIIQELTLYMHHTRPLFFDTDLKENADLVLNGHLSVEENLYIIKKRLKIESEQLDQT